MTIYSRTDIGLVPPKSVTPLGTMNTVYIHHTGGGNGAYSPEEAMAALRGIQQYHMNGEYVDIAYNFGFDQVGNVYDLRGYGVMGGATYGENANSYAFVWIGDSNAVAPTDAALKAMASTLSRGVQSGYLYDTVMLRGHRDAAATACPGDSLYNSISKIANYFSGGGGTMDEATARAWVQEDYNTILGRDPDPAGWDFWAGKLMEGSQRNDIRWIFLTSTEGISALRNRIAVLEQKVGSQASAPNPNQMSFDDIAKDISRRISNG